MGKVKTYYTKDILKLDLAERMGYDLTPYIQEITSYF